MEKLGAHKKNQNQKEKENKHHTTKKKPTNPPQKKNKTTKKKQTNTQNPKKKKTSMHWQKSRPSRGMGTRKEIRKGGVLAQDWLLIVSPHHSMQMAAMITPSNK